MIFTCWRKQRCSILKLIGERLDHVTAHFVTTWPSRGTNCHSQVRRLRLVPFAQTLNCRNGNGCQRSPPPGVNSCKSSGLRVSHQDRNAVSSLYSSQYSGRSAHNRVAVDCI